MSKNEDDSDTLDLFADEVDTDDVTPEARLPDVLARHATLAGLIRAELARSRNHAGYLRGLAAVEKNAEVKQALLDFAQQISAGEWA